MTFNEAFDQYFQLDGFTNFIPRYIQLIEGKSEEPDDESRLTRGTAGIQAYDVEKNAKEASVLIKKAFPLFWMIVRAGDFGLDEPEHLVVQTALHESLLNTLYHIDSNCRDLLKSQVQVADDDLDKYLERLKHKHSLSENDFDHLRQKWFFDSQELFESLASREYKLRLFVEGEQVAFQVFNSELNPAISLPRSLCTPSRLIVSRYYFVLRLFDIFRHLDLITRVLKVEKPIEKDENDFVMATMTGMDDFVETAAMEVFIKAAAELRDKVL
jgi:hypothetical protein